MKDLLIIGGGPVGSALALALRGSGLRVALLEARDDDASGDRRGLALSYGSRLILERIGAWQALSGAMTPIESIHVSQRGGFGRALLTAAEAGLPALGYVAAYGAVYASLARLARASAHVDVLRGARADALSPGPHDVEVVYSEAGADRSVRGRLAVLADGGELSRSSAEHAQRPYGQSALVAQVRTDRPHGRRAYERFTAQGPLALLPAQEGFALIWTVTPACAQHLLALHAREFLLELQDCFGERAGRFLEAGERAAYPLALRVAGPAHDPRLLLLGNAAQALHPVAGQGLNLGLRDAWDLAQLIRAQPQRMGEPAFAARYLGARATDRGLTIRLTDTLVRVFSNDLAPLRWLRGCGLTALDCMPAPKRGFTAQMIFGA
jgi:2-octaprenyl-6-methoxyphenol hydroxylase